MLLPKPLNADEAVFPGTVDPEPKPRVLVLAPKADPVPRPKPLVPNSEPNDPLGVPAPTKVPELPNILVGFVFVFVYLNRTPDFGALKKLFVLFSVAFD